MASIVPTLGERVLTFQQAVQCPFHYCARQHRLEERHRPLEIGRLQRAKPIPCHQHRGRQPSRRSVLDGQSWYVLRDEHNPALLTNRIQRTASRLSFSVSTWPMYAI